MAKKNEREVLEVGVDMKSALADMAKMERATTRNFAEIAKAVEELSDTTSKANKDAKKGAESVEASVEDLFQAYKKEAKGIDNVLQNIDLLKKHAKNASKEEQANLEESIQLLKEKGKETLKSLKARDRAEGRTISSKVMHKAGDDLKRGFTEALSGFNGTFNRDLKTSVGSSAKTFVRALKLGASSAALGSSKASAFGAGLSERGKARGGVGGMAMQGGGGAMKALGAMTSKLGPLIQIFSQLGPMLGLLGSTVMGIVKMFIDVDAKAKEFNKDLLSSASTTEFMARNGSDVNLAFTDMADTLKGMRNSAFSLQNLDWGITAAEHKAVVNVLNQEGVSLANVAGEAKKTYGALMGDTAAVQKFSGELVHTSIAFSRNFGVPLQEINQLQAEMVTELGQGLAETAFSFQRIKNTAEETGVSANKFFGMIKGVSQDLSLWGNRMEDAVTLLGRMNKYMNPREAQKFFQVTMQGLKNMGRTDRLRLSLIAGGGSTDRVLKSSIASQTRKFSGQLEMSPEEFTKKLEGGLDAFKDDLAKVKDKSQLAAIRSGIISAQMMTQQARGGTYSKAMALRNVGGAGAIEEKVNAVKRLSGAKSLQEAVSGASGHGQMSAEAMGISEEELEQALKFEKTINDQKKALVKQLKTGTAVEKKNAKDALKRSGIEGDNEEALAKKVDAAGYQDIMDTFDQDTQDIVNGVEKTKDYAKIQTELTQSWQQKFEVLMDFIMNAMYDILQGIWEAVASIPGVMSNEEKLTRKAVYDSGDKDLIASLSKNKGMSGFRGDLIMNKGLGKGVGDAIDRWRKSSPEDRAGGIDADMRRVITNIDSGFRDLGKGGAVEAAQATLKDAGVGDDAKLKIKADMSQGADFSKALKDANLSADQVDEVLKKALWHISTTSLTGEGFSSLRGKSPTSTSPTTTAAAVNKPVEATAAAAEESLGYSKESLKTFQSVDAQMDKFKMDTGFLSGPYSKAVEGSVLAAMRTALFEYYLYKDINQGDMLKSMQEGGLTGRSMSSAMSQWAVTGGSGPAIDALRKHATGGLVTGVNGGLASVTAAAGEGLASVGKGETIVPAGGGKGGNTYQINVPGIGGQELARAIEAKVIDTIYEYKRREKFV